MLTGYENPTLLEIGAHTGEELPDFKHAKHIWTFEPSPDKAPSINKVIKDNGLANKTDFYNMAMSNETGELKFWVNGTKSQQNTVGAPPPWVSQERFDKSAIKIPVITIDDFWRNYAKKAHITMVKADTQGHEPAIIQGAKELLSQDPPDLIHMEFAPNLYKQNGGNGTEMLYTLYDFGYICFDCQAFKPPAMEAQFRHISEYEKHFGNFRFKGANHGAWADLICMK